MSNNTQTIRITKNPQDDDDCRADDDIHGDTACDDKPNDDTQGDIADDDAAAV